MATPANDKIILYRETGLYRKRAIYRGRAVNRDTTRIVVSPVEREPVVLIMNKSASRVPPMRFRFRIGSAIRVVQLNLEGTNLQTPAISGVHRELSAKKSGDKTLLVLHQILEAAFKWGLSSEMPTFIWLPKQKPKKKLFPPELFEDLVGNARAEGPDTFALVLLAGEMAMRTGELQGLCWEQIDWRRGRLTVDRQIYEELLKLPKREKTRAFKPTPRTMVALKEMRHFRSDFVFADEEGRPWTKRRVESTCQRLYRSVGMRRRIGPHGLRHAAIQRMSLAGVPLDVIRQITGHADFRILQEYLHDDVEATGRVGAKLASHDFAGEAGGFGEILEKPSGAEVHILARARRRRG